MSVLEMKTRISWHINISLDRLIFIRGGSHGTEIKQDSISIKAASLYNNVCIYVQHGIPSKENEKRLKFILVEKTEQKVKYDDSWGMSY